MNGSRYCSPRCHYDDRGRQGGASPKRTQPYHRCRNCGTVFAWNGAGKGVYCSQACKRGAPVSAEVDIVEVVVLRGHRKADWLAIPLGACEHPKCAKRSIHRHHVVFSQHVRNAKGDQWDPANAVVLCGEHHAELHNAHSFPILALPSAALEFAAALLGRDRAHEYLRRRYAGTDPRLAALLLPPNLSGAAPPLHGGDAACRSDPRSDATGPRTQL